jgi:hypothetical protein
MNKTPAYDQLNERPFANIIENFTYQHEQGNNNSVIPRLLDTAPLQCKEKGHSHTEREDRPNPV